MSQFPSLPLFTDAFIADTGHLNAHETGAYLMLLMMAWRSPGCRLPDDDEKLARWARVDARQWSRTKPKVMEFWTLDDGFWTQKRLASELLKVHKFALASRENGKRGGRPKSLKTQEPENPMGSRWDTQPITQSKAPNPNPNPNKKKEEASASSKKQGLRIPEAWQPDELFALREGMGAGDVKRQADRFRDYWKARPGKEGVKLDWDATWRNWVRKFMDSHRRPATVAHVDGRI